MQESNEHCNIVHFTKMSTSSSCHWGSFLRSAMCGKTKSWSSFGFKKLNGTKHCKFIPLSWFACPR